MGGVPIWTQASSIQKSEQYPRDVDTIKKNPVEATHAMEMTKGGKAADQLIEVGFLAETQLPRQSASLFEKTTFIK